MEIRYVPDRIRMMRMTTEELRAGYMVENLMQEGALRTVYTDVDRAIIGGAVPADEPLTLSSARELAADYFCERRELGVINVGAEGTISVDGTAYRIGTHDCLYVGRGSREITFTSVNSADPARFYLLSYPAHREFPTTHATPKQASPVRLGSPESCNVRTIYKYIYPDGIRSCQLVMGFTVLESGSIWNTMPAHTHERRSEIYFYFNIPGDQVVFHMMGPGDETRHLVVRNHQAVISPSWSIHSGAGTANYAFIWGMGGENQAFDDMDHIALGNLR